jgi:hypothetical protein
MNTQSTTRPATTTPASTRNSMHTEITTKKTARRSFTLHTSDDHTDELRASQLVNVAAEEIAWFYTSYDNALASRFARSIIEGWLATLDPAVRRVLALRFDVAPWAEDIQDEGLKSGFALAVNLVTAAKWGANSGPRNGAHRRAGEHLEAAIREKGVGVLRDIGRRADWDFAAAVRAYAKARGRSPSVLPREAA